MLGPNPDITLARIGYEAFTAELQKLGFSQGKNLQLDYRRTDQGMDLAVAAARELVTAKANVIVAVGSEISLRAALAPNSGLPIVILAFNYDPIARGYVESLGLAMKSIKLTSPPYDFEKAFRTAEENGVQFLLILSSPLFAPHNKEIVDLTMRYQLPTMFTFKFYVEAGGLMSYGVDTEPLFRRGAAFVAKILRGGQASDLPVEQASNFELALNLKTAKAAGFTLPTSILLRANEVIE
jgi:putative tryptophan/tyrosine transport system substrate-binding protein